MSEEERTYTIEDLEGALRYFNAKIIGDTNPNGYSSCSNDCLKWMKFFQFSIESEITSMKEHNLKKQTIM